MTETRSDEDYVRDALRRLNPECHTSDYSWEALNRLVAQHRHTRDALARAMALLAKPHFSKGAYLCRYCWRADGHTDYCEAQALSGNAT